jgi:hypothetical protein
MVATAEEGPCSNNNKKAGNGFLEGTGPYLERWQRSEEWPTAANDDSSDGGGPPTRTTTMAERMALPQTTMTAQGEQPCLKRRRLGAAATTNAGNSPQP